MEGGGAAAWVALSRIAGLGGSGFKRLVEHFGDPTLALQASAGDLARVKGLNEVAMEALASFTDWSGVEEELRRAEQAGIRIVPFASNEYPARLRAIADPPPFLYVKGALQPADDRAVAVVGSRSASDYGRRIASELCRGLAAAGFTVVSGMARGIDGAAHEGALAAHGRTIAVLGSGADRVYPPEHVGLYRRIAERGAVLSELPLGSRPMAHHFPARNRLISGLSLGVVVVEATEKSGSLITAELAAEQGREIFAVPGPAGSSRSRGPHQLIRRGAKLVESVGDIIEEIAPQLPAVSSEGPGHDALALAPDAPEDVRQVFEMLREESRHVDELIDATGLPAGRISEILLNLELQGYLKQLPGGRYAVER